MYFNVTCVISQKMQLKVAKCWYIIGLDITGVRWARELTEWVSQERKKQDHFKDGNTSWKLVWEGHGRLTKIIKWNTHDLEI